MTARFCRFCNRIIRPAGSAWLDRDGWESCDGTGDFHEPNEGEHMTETTERPAEVSAEHARVHLARLLRDAEYGRTKVITRNGKPVARLVPYGVAVDELAEVDALIDGLEMDAARLRDHIRRHATTPAQEDPS